MNYKVPLAAFVLSIGMIGGLASGAIGDITNPTAQTDSTSESVNYDDTVIIKKNGEKLFETENALMEGEAIIRNQSLAGSNPYSYDYISLGNGDAPTDSSASLDQEITSLNLSAKQADIQKLAGSDQNEWRLTAEWTATGTETVNTTAVKSPNAPSDIDYYAGTDFDRNVNLQADDKLTVEWTFDVQ